MTFAQEELNVDDRDSTYLEFIVDKEYYGISIRYVTEIIGMQKVNALPEAPEYVKGIINLRGRIIPVIDMRRRINKEEIAYTDRTCIVVVETENLSVGLIVDSVNEVLDIDEREIVPPPEMNMAGSHGFLSGIAKVSGGVKLLLDCEKLFDLSETGIINNIAEREQNHV